MSDKPLAHKLNISAGGGESPSIELAELKGTELRERRQTSYRRYLGFIHSANQKDRLDVNRRIRSVVIWCFLVPVFVVALGIFLANRGFIPRVFRSYQDWVLLLFPVLYSLYFLGSQVLSELPAAFRRGGFGLTLGQTASEADWRLDTCARMEKELNYSAEEWEWIISNAEEDLERLQMRLRHLTALAGAVFFLLMQGIDSLTNDGSLSKDLTQSLMGPSSSEWVGLALFLLLLYLSGQQNLQTFRRFMGCARLVQRQRKPGSGQE